MKIDNASVMDELFPNPKLVDDLFVPIEVFTLKIVQQLPALTDHSKQTAPGVDVFFMRFEVIRQGIDLTTEQCDLDLRRARIFRMAAESLDDFRFLLLFQHNPFSLS